MASSSVTSNLLSVPVDAGRVIVEAAALMVCPLLGTDKFAAFCTARDLVIDSKRLLQLERLGLFAPVFRVRTPEDDSVGPFHVPVRQGKNWFDLGLAWDTTQIPMQHEIPEEDDKSQQGYYSIFQIDWLRCVLSQMNLNVHVDSYLGENEASLDERGRKLADWIRQLGTYADSSRLHDYRPSVALLCQYISNRYYPRALGDRRTIRTGSTCSWDTWTSIGDHLWDWEEQVRAWDAKEVEARYKLTPEKLKHAYETLAGGQSFVDPLESWYPLVQFVSLDKRRRLKRPALQAETLREGALMLRWLYDDLYGEELPPPNEVFGTVITHVPELAVRTDVRRYLELVVNDYGINPQPKLVLFVEGQSEEQIVNRLFDELFGFSASKAWIELQVIGGVDNATGGKKDRYRAILRLIDYLHHHQTLAFLLLDNENKAERLKDAASNAGSIYGKRKHITRPEYVRVWKQSLEFDNFSDTELATALCQVSEGKHTFGRGDVAKSRQSVTPGAALTNLYKSATGYDLPKRQLADILVDTMLSENSRRAVKNRPIVKLLQRVVNLAMRNPLPTMLEIWEKNQTSKILAKKKW